MFVKIIVIGNSGSGKTWLAAKLAKTDNISVIHLDELFWEPGGFDKKRSKETVLQLVKQSKANYSWIVEGVFGELAELYMDQADFLIWLDVGWDICKKRLIQRGSESKRHMAREQSEEGLRKLVEWALHYYDRNDLRSHAGHKNLFKRFPRKKFYIQSVSEVNRIAECGLQ